MSLRRHDSAAFDDFASEDDTLGAMLCAEGQGPHVAATLDRLSVNDFTTTMGRVMLGLVQRCYAAGHPVKPTTAYRCLRRCKVDRVPVRRYVEALAGSGVPSLLPVYMRRLKAAAARRALAARLDTARAHLAAGDDVLDVLAEVRDAVTA